MIKKDENGVPLVLTVGVYYTEEDGVLVYDTEEMLRELETMIEALPKKKGK